MKWYRTQQMGVKWAGSVSEPFSVENGMRQGGNLSPLLFNVYIDELLCELRKLPIGCQVGKCAVNVLAYADDIVLLSPTREGLQTLVQRCETFAITRDINFNVRKTVCMVFNPQKPYGLSHLSGSKPPTIFLNGHSLVWVETFKYLGHVFASNLSDGPDMCRVKRSLYYSVNMICARVGHANRNILIKLFRAYCTNMYGCELWNTAGVRKAFHDLCVAYHSCIKKLVRVPRWTRNHDLCKELSLLPCPMLVASRQLLFQQRLLFSDNSIIRAMTESEVGTSGMTAKTHLQIREQYGLMALNLLAVGKADISNIFVAHRDRFVHDRLLRAWVKLWKYHWGPKLSWGPPFEGASVLMGLQDFSAEALRGNSFSILSLHRKQSYQSSAGVRVYLAGNMCILTYCLYAAFIPISGRLLATPISGKGGCLWPPPPWDLRFLPVDF